MSDWPVGANSEPTHLVPSDEPADMDVPHKGVEALTPETRWILVDARGQDYGFGPFPNKKAAIAFGKAQDYIVYGMFRLGSFPVRKKIAKSPLYSEQPHSPVRQ